MKRKALKLKWKRSLSFILSLALTVPALGTTVFASEISKDSNQIASFEETVYLNSYGGDKRSTDFNKNWKFNLGEVNGAQKLMFDDSSWKTVDIPHDYSIEQEYTTGGEGESGYLPGGIGWYRKTFTLDPTLSNKVVTVEFDGVYMDATVYLNGQELGKHPYGYTDFAFVLPHDVLDFNGENVIAVRVNHQLPSSRFYSGSGIYRDVKLTVTDSLHIERRGVVVTSPKLQESKGTDGQTDIKVTIVNKDNTEKNNITVVNTIYNDEGTSVATVSSDSVSLEGNSTKTVTASVALANPELWNSWDLGNPSLYTIRTEIKQDNTVIDTIDTIFGYRYYSFDRTKGFSLNGTPLKFKGVCMHHDQGAVGSEAWYAAISRQVRILKEMGCNAIRVTHNPAAEALIDICNREGMLVIDEAFDGWSHAKNSNNNDYARFFNVKIEESNQILGKSQDMTWGEFDAKAMVKRGINAPSIIMWSLGNEIEEGSSSGGYVELAKNIVDWVSTTDPTRPITIGENRIKNNNQTMLTICDYISQHNGIIGFNYADWATMKRVAGGTDIRNNWIVYGSEFASHVNSRGVYEVTGGKNDPTSDKALTSYDTSRVDWGATTAKAWWETIRFDGNAGEFVWTGFDYIGEPTPWNKIGPNEFVSPFETAPKSSYFGIVDTAGLPKDNYYLYRSLWNETDTTLHILPTWDRQDVKLTNGNVRVNVYSNAAKVKLYLNEKLVGEQEMVTNYSTTGWDETKGQFIYRTVKGESGETSLYYKFDVKYEEGTLRAEAYDEKGQVISNTYGRSFVSTTKGASKLSLSKDKAEISANGKDLMYVTVEIQDQDGQFVNSAQNPVTFKVQGPAKIIGVDNGVQTDHTSYQSLTRKAGRGKVVAIVQSTEQAGEITVTATAQGLESGEIKFNSVASSAEESSVKPVSITLSKNYYLKTGTQISLPEKIKVNFSNDSSQEYNVSWNTENLNTSTAGNHLVKGTVSVSEELSIIATINVKVLDDIAALLNYSGYTSLNGKLTLPESRPAVTADGTILDAYFPVDWEEEKFDSSKEGIQIIAGTAQVFGKTLKVSANIRVSNTTYTKANNVVKDAVKLESSSDTNLEIIRDNQYQDTQGWNGIGDIRLGYDTAQSINEIKLYLGNTAPTSDSIKLYWSGNGSTWQSLDSAVSNEKGEGMTIRSFTFEPVSAVWVKLEFTKPVNLREVELTKVIPSFPIGSEAALSELEVDGRFIESDSLLSGKYGYPQTDLSLDKIKAVGKDNASVTILEKYNDVIKLLLESEDQSTRRVFSINLGSSDNLSGAGDSSSDYDYRLTTATAGSEMSSKNEGASNVVDGDENTLWHSDWNDNLKDKEDKRYIQIELKQRNESGNAVALTEDVKVYGIRLLPRTGSHNGVITKYRIEVSSTGEEGSFVPVEQGSGDWDSSRDWKLATFTPTNAKFVRIYGVETLSDGNANKFISAREVRVLVEQKDLFEVADITFDQASYDYNGAEITPKPVVTPKANSGVVLTEGKDYLISYENNQAPGKAFVYVRGTGEYRGTARFSFTINEAEVSISTLASEIISTKIGFAPVLPGTVTAVMSDGTRKEVEINWNSISEDQLVQVGEFHIEGTVTDTALKAIAYITVEDIPEEEQEVKNLSLEPGTKALSWFSHWDYANVNKLANAIDGSKEFKTGNDKVIWDDWERNTYHTDQNWYAVLFDSTNIINKVSVGFTLETNGAQNRVNLPKDYEIQYYTGPDFTLDESNMQKVKNWAEDHPLKDPNNWKTVVYTSDKPAVPSEENDDFKRMVDINFQPIEARLVRISFVPQENQWVGLEEFEVYSGGSVTKENDSFEVVSVTIEGNNILDQLLSDTGYSRELAEDEIIPEILVSATNNAKITIQRPETEEGIVIISILPENGDLTKKVVYHLEFTRKQVIALVEEILLTPSTEEGLVVLTGNTQQFTAVVKGTGEFDSTVIWSVEGALSQGTTIDEKGLLTVDSGETADSLTIKAVSATDSSKTAVTNVTIKKAEPSGGDNPQQPPTDPSQGTTPGGDSPNPSQGGDNQGGNNAVVVKPSQTPTIIYKTETIYLQQPQGNVVETSRVVNNITNHETKNIIEEIIERVFVRETPSPKVTEVKEEETSELAKTEVSTPKTEESPQLVETQEEEVPMADQTLPDSTPQQQPAWLWIVIGVLIGGICAAGAYFYINKKTTLDS